MCVFVGSEVVLANVLSHKNGVSIYEVRQYCEKLKEELSHQESNKSVYINFNSKSLESTLLKYKKEFRRFQDRYFVNEEISLEQFNGRFDEETASVLESVAQTI